MTDQASTTVPEEATSDGGAAEYRSIWTHLRELDFRQSVRVVGGVRTRFVEAGDPAKPALVLLHGTGGHWETFAANLGPLSEHFRCVSLDMVGNGFSEKPDRPYEVAGYVDHVFSLLDHLGIGKAALMGTSLGAWVAARAALTHADRVTALILCSPAGLIATKSNMERIRAERTKAVEDPNWESIRAMFVNLLAEERNRIPDLIALRQAIYRLPETRDAIDNILALQDPDIRARNLLSEQEWAAIAVPALVVASGKDHNEYQGTAHRVARLIPRAQLLELPHVRHWPHFEDPELFNGAAVRFLLGR